MAAPPGLRNIRARSRLRTWRRRERAAWVMPGLLGSQRLPGPQHRRMEQLGLTAPVQLGRPAAGRTRRAGLDEESVRAGHLPVEVARIEWSVPDDLIDPAQVGDGELVTAEGRAERCVLELRPRSLDAVLENPAVVEGKLGQVSERLPAHPGLLRRGQIGRDAEVGDRN